MRNLLNHPLVYLVATALVFGSAAPAVAQVTEILSTKNIIRSTSDRMISMRHQERVVETVDGAIHLIVNQGDLGLPGAAMSLFSSFDAGNSWQRTQSFDGTSTESTPDALLVGDSLYVTWFSDNYEIVFCKLQYDQTTGLWSVDDLETAFSAQFLEAQNPALALDSNDRIWLTFLVRKVGSGQREIRMLYRDLAGSGWQGDHLRLGTLTTSAEPGRSARPVQVPGGMGVVFTHFDELRWAFRNDVDSPDSPWTESLITNLTYDSSTDPYASHYSVAVDENGLVHVAVSVAADLLYLQGDPETDIWTQRYYDLTPTVRFPQVTTSPGKISIIANTNSVAIVLQSIDGGSTFTFTHRLTHPMSSPFRDVTFPSPKIEAPANAQDAIPVFQQYVVDGIQRLLYFSIPLED